MRMLVLTSIRFKTGDQEYDGPRLVVVNGSPDEDPNAITERATNVVMREFKEFYPQSELIFATPHPTFGQYSNVSKAQTESIGMQYPPFHNSDEHPAEIPDAGFSEDVLIDTDGWRRKFVVGWYDFEDKEWVSDVKEVTIDQKNMKWTYLPHSKEVSSF